MKYIVYSTDNNYIRYAATSIVSIMENNRGSEYAIYIIEDNVDMEEKNKFIEIENKYDTQICFIPFQQYKDKLKLNLQWNISLSAYARLFAAEILPKDADIVLYLDCDTVILENIDSLFNEDISKLYVAGVQDTIAEGTKRAVGLVDDDIYINSGVLLINLKKWREDNLIKKFLEFIDEHNGSVMHHDQGVINSVCHQEIGLVGVRYNVMTMHYMLSYKHMLSFTGEKNYHYSEENIKSACEQPKIVHFTPCFTTRPWMKNCKHPLAKEFWKYYNLTPWREIEIELKDELWYRKFYGWTYRKLPFKLAEIIWAWKEKR